MPTVCQKPTDLLEAYDAHAPMLYRHCVQKTKSEQDAEELVQDAFMNAFKYLHNGKTIENTKTFLFAVANNLIVDKARSNKQKNREVSLDELCEKGFDVGHDGTQAMQKKLDAVQVLKAAHGLNKEDYEIFVMRFVEGLMPMDIAQKTGLTKNVVSVRLNRAVKNVISEIESQS